MVLCEYGCNKEAKFRIGSKNTCERYSTQCEVNKKKNSEGLKLIYKKGRKVCSFNNSARINSNIARINNLKQKPFEEWGRKLREELIFQEQNKLCFECNCKPIWNNKELKFHLDHIDGNHNNNKRENLRLLCPNCHSQTETYCGRNINNGLKKINDEQIKELINKGKNTRQILIELGLAAKGGNYKRIKKLRT